MAKNHIGLQGFDFIEFSSPYPDELHDLFTTLGFSRKMKHGQRDIDLYVQNDIYFLLNREKHGFANDFQKAHGPCACSTGWRVADASEAFEVALSRGAKASPDSQYQRGGGALPALEGVGGSLIYLVDEAKSSDKWGNMGFSAHPEPVHVESKGFHLIDHLTNNVPQGQLEPLAEFYKSVFGFEEVRYFDIRGKETGLLSYALRSPCGSFCIPINEGTEEKSQINEYLREYHGSGIQHIAFLTADIIQSMDQLQGAAIETLDIDDDYYDEVFDRVPGVTEDHKKIQEYNLLVDGDESGYLVQIFTQNVIGPIFFEFIQRKNHQGFGEGNFGALFRAIERDQKRRGVL